MAITLVDHSGKDGTGDAINGSEVDENSNTLNNVLNGITATTLNASGLMQITASYTTPLTFVSGTNYFCFWIDFTDTNNPIFRVKAAAGAKPTIASATDGRPLQMGGHAEAINTAPTI